MNKISKCTLALAIVLVSALITNQSAQAQTFATLYSFCSEKDCKDGADPYAGLIQGTDGNLYGTTEFGGTGSCSDVDGCGTAFKISLSGALTTLHRFVRSTDGAEPIAGLAQAVNGDLYGTASVGGTNNDGTVFKVMPTGKFTVLHTFAGTDGETPWGTPILGTDGDLFGTTYEGGANESLGGTVFKITPGGTLTTLYSSVDIYWNPFAGLVQATNGEFYGMSQYAGTGACNHGCGTIFRFADGTVTTVYNFAGQEGSPPWPYAPLVQGTTGELYGMTEENGSDSSGTVFRVTTGGTKFKTLHSFDMSANPTSGLIQATDGNFYGTTNMDGANEAGTIFKITPSGTLTVLYNFCSQESCTDGGDPQAGLIQDTNGNLYGTTYYGGANGKGAVFSLSIGLGPFVSTQINSGMVGGAVTILGTDLTGATSVTFNGTPATFTVVSASEITTTVPTGATTGFIVVTTPGGTLTSNKMFNVKT
jgi:uncharacterized repeat protein (TIGR03803 family)